jgi:subtilisin family serine protease
MLRSALRRDAGIRFASRFSVARLLAPAVAVALPLTACLDDPIGPPAGLNGDPTPQLSTAPAGVPRTGGGAEPTHLGIAPGGGPDLIPAGARAGDVIPGQYIVVFRDNVLSAASLAPQLAAAHRGTLRFTYTAALKGFAAKLSDQAVAALARNPQVAYVEPDRVARVSTTQQLDVSGEPWGLDRIDERDWPYTGTYTYTRTGSGVTAYIFDTGVRASHPEFGTRASNVYDAFGGNGDDCHGHGTHVAGTVGGRIFGVAKQVRLRGVRVLNCEGSGSWSGIIAGIDWVRQNRVNPAVANLSLGGSKSAAVNQAVNNLAASGVFVAVAAGNERGNACNYSPSSASAAFATAASTWFDLAAVYTNQGSCVDAYAPGDDIKSASIYYPDGLRMSGTSMASPHVAGVAALYKHKFGNASSATITSWLKTNATRNAIQNNELYAPGTPNLLLYKGTL